MHRRDPAIHFAPDIAKPPPDKGEGFGVHERGCSSLVRGFYPRTAPRTNPPGPGVRRWRVPLPRIMPSVWLSEPAGGARVVKHYLGTKEAERASESASEPDRSRQPDRSSIPSRSGRGLPSLPLSRLAVCGQPVVCGQPGIWCPVGQHQIRSRVVQQTARGLSIRRTDLIVSSECGRIWD